jgi:hypothetical protein
MLPRINRKGEPMKPNDLLLTFAEAAADKQVSLSILHDARHYGNLIAIRKTNGRLYVRRRELDRWAAERALAEAEWREGVEQRRQERQERRERWLARLAAEHGLVPAPEAGRAS